MALELLAVNPYHIRSHINHDPPDLVARVRCTVHPNGVAASRELELSKFAVLW